VRRPCLDCGTPTEGSRCPTHRRGWERTRRPTATKRGYDVSHRRAREALKAELPGGCGYGCGTLLMPDGDWVAAHVVDGAPEFGYIASCRTCNERAKVRRP
jgi:hypothetical protein